MDGRVKNVIHFWLSSTVGRNEGLEMINAIRRITLSSNSPSASL